MTDQNVDDTQAEKTGDVIGKEYHAQYKEHGGNCGDDLAKILKDFTAGEKGKLNEEALQQVATDNGVDFPRYEKLNPGQKRMTIGNILRGKHRRGEDVVIGNTVFAGDETAKAMAAAKEAAKAEKAAAKEAAKAEAEAAE